MASGAFHTGLMENLHSLTELLEQDHVIYHKGYNASELRRMFVKKELPDTFDWTAVSDLLLKILGRKENAMIFSTKPLEQKGWENVPMNTLFAYKNGNLLYTGTNHGHEFVNSEAKMRLLFLDYANL